MISLSEFLSHSGKRRKDHIIEDTAASHPKLPDCGEEYSSREMTWGSRRNIGLGLSLESQGSPRYNELHDLHNSLCLRGLVFSLLLPHRFCEVWIKSLHWLYVSVVVSQIGVYILQRCASWFTRVKEDNIRTSICSYFKSYPLKTFYLWHMFYNILA